METDPRAEPGAGITRGRGGDGAGHACRAAAGGRASAGLRVRRGRLGRRSQRRHWGGRLAAEHLINRGATQLLFLGDTTGIEIARRLTGVQQAVSAANVTLTHFPLHLSDEEIVANIGTALATPSQSFDGIVAASDLIAMAALNELYLLEKSVPDDVQVIGYDDLPLAAQTRPPLTTIRQDIASGAKAMIDKLKHLIDNGAEESLVMPPLLVERSTSRKLKPRVGASQ